MDIEQKELVTTLFGQWPSFHDAEVFSIELRRGNESGDFANLKTSVRLQKYQPINVGTALYDMEKTQDVIITFEFFNIKNLEMDGFNYQNVIDALNIVPSDQGISVEFESIFGVQCSFICQSIKVLSVISRLEG